MSEFYSMGGGGETRTLNPKHVGMSASNSGGSG